MASHSLATLKYDIVYTGGGTLLELKLAGTPCNVLTFKYLYSQLIGKTK